MVSVDRMLISMLSVSSQALDMWCADAAEAPRPLACDLNLDELLSPLHQMYNPRNPNLSCIPF